MSPELDYLANTGFLDARAVIYTAPGQHDNCEALEKQLAEALDRARQSAERVIVVYGGRMCYINRAQPERTIDTVLARLHPCAQRTCGDNCVDLLAGRQDRLEMSGTEEVYWITPGWIENREYVFGDWDEGLADAAFPRYSGGALVLDAVDYYDRLLEESPEKLTELSDWMKISIMPKKISLNRLKALLVDCVIRDLEARVSATPGEDDKNQAAIEKRLSDAKTARVKLGDPPQATTL
jgi:hypothetical protein